ncbi:hypothetical protein DFH07DRAFT_833457 [Mycena maculata]|uniref:Uncharacterized protein n=1 Tax=Mycena maculata TaxID=230809 RepID=A0AAD7ILG1_9AGAR|nr:hypothetical protein DFH07DRAFT_833457 [Mycena maculata]
MATNTQWRYCHHSSTNQYSDSEPLQPRSVAQWRHRSIRSPSQYPPTPRIPYLMLPDQPAPTHFPSITPDLFPINLLWRGLSPLHASLLSDSIPAFTTISVRDASNQILCNMETGPCVLTTADFTEFLQYMVCSPLPSYADLSPIVRESVKVNFLYRSAGQGREQWERFALGTPRFGGPTGRDLLLGNTLLWTLDPDLCGVWIATVDVPRVPYQLW